MHKRVVVILIKPSHYDDDGFPHRYLRGVLPSNSLAVLYSLTCESLATMLPTDTSFEVHMLEDGVQKHARKLRELETRFPEAGTKLIVGLVAVQTAQFPRACDLITRWQQRGATCVIGGFHVSGSIATMLDGVSDRNRPDIPSPHRMPTEIQRLIDSGVVVFHGEAEEVWAQTLADMLAGNPKPLYRGGMPDFGSAPLPKYAPGYFEGSFVTAIGTFDTGRGCPFACSFCAIINVQGRKSRYRSPECVIAQIKEICAREGKAQFFFTDDNFARNPLWETLLDGIIALREAGAKVRFMCEADLACRKIPRFLDKLARAGCGQIFMGVESVNPRNLVDAHKPQNKVHQYAELWSRCHELGIVVHAGYIIGFAGDSAESVAEDVETLRRLGADQVSFFILTPLPGSEDHARAVAANVAMDTDFSKYDSFHILTEHPQMSRQAWMETYQKAWRQFYRCETMLAAVKRCHTRSAQIELIRNYVWYRWSFATEQTHPMISGFYRVRSYSDRRPGSAELPYGRYVRQEVWRNMRYIGRLVAEFYRFQYIVLDTECSEQLRDVRDWFRLTFGKRMSRQWLHAFWKKYAANRWRLLYHPVAVGWHLACLPFAFTEVVYTLRFAARVSRLIKATT